METYLIKASAILGIFLLTYQLLLRKETFFRLNRFFLLTGIGAALLLPLVTIQEEVIIPMELITAQSASPNPGYSNPETGSGWEMFLWAGYLRNGRGSIHWSRQTGLQLLFPFSGIFFTIRRAMTRKNWH